MNNRNQEVGQRFEREIVQYINRLVLNDSTITGNELREVQDSRFLLFPKLGTSREFNKEMDKRKVDIVSINKSRQAEFPYLIQAKNLVGGAAPYPKLLNEVRTKNLNGIPVVLHRQTAKVNSKFVTKGEFACMYMNDFIDLILKIKRLEYKVDQLQFNAY